MARFTGTGDANSNSNSDDQNEIDRILSPHDQDEILPSSGFAASVMDAVRREAAAPPPIPFPWKRALPGLVAASAALAIVLSAAITSIVRMGGKAPLYSPLPSAMPFILSVDIKSAAMWTMLALFTALVSVKLTMRLCGTE